MSNLWSSNAYRPYTPLLWVIYKLGLSPFFNRRMLRGFRNIRQDPQSLFTDVLRFSIVDKLFRRHASTEVSGLVNECHSVVGIRPRSPCLSISWRPSLADHRKASFYPILTHVLARASAAPWSCVTPNSLHPPGPSDPCPVVYRRLSIGPLA